LSQEITFVLPTGRGDKRLKQLADFSKSLVQFVNEVGFKISARGWCYQIEGEGLIDKSQFDRVENLINECRKNGMLPVDFVATEEVEASLKCENYYTPDWWENEDYYIQMVVEKIDVKSLFEPICKEYHIPIATSKGWSSILQRGVYARRFKRAEEKGLKCVLLYCGDFDPDGLRISEFLRKNLEDIANIRWMNRETGYNPSSLIIKRFGLEYDFIEENNLTWVDNLITGSKKNLANPNHPNFNMPYVQEYLATIGERKCEANSMLKRKDEARDLCRDAIEEYLGEDALGRFQSVRDAIVSRVETFRDDTDLTETIQDAIKLIEEEQEREEFGEDD
jgi:hypothetical protein